MLSYLADRRRQTSDGQCSGSALFIHVCFVSIVVAIICHSVGIMIRCLLVKCLQRGQICFRTTSLAVKLITENSIIPSMIVLFME